MHYCIVLSSPLSNWWDISAMDNLPTDYLKFLFQLVINVYDEIEKEMSTEGRPYAASYAKEREEQTRAGGHVASGVECYMKEHHMNRERAVEEIKTKIKYAWKEINEEFLRPTPMPMHILMRALNLVRTEHVFYKDIDGYTYSRGVKDDIMATYAAPIPI
ncbi:hypothetical protein Ancab_034113 [Ancistrocladus abbreviatus]